MYTIGIFINHFVEGRTVMMTDLYLAPDFILEEYEACDVITTSAENDNDQDAGIWD